MASRLEVHKFGGTSVADADRLRAVSDLLAGLGGEARVVAVTSALGSVTDRLVEAASLAAEQRRDEALAVAEEIRLRHEETLASLSCDDAQEVGSECEAILAEVRDLLRGTVLVGALSPRVRDRVLSCGEKLAARLLAAALRAAGTPAVALDADTFLETDEVFGEANPLPGVADRTIRAQLLDHLDAGRLPVITGFCGRGPDGATTTLGRSGSDLTATVIAKAVGADEVTIWTDVDGVYSADPRVEPDARVIPHLNYREAAEMSYYGARVLYQRTMIPIVDPGIPLRVRNSFAPQRPGTVIDGRYRPGAHPVKAIPAIPEHCLVTLQGKGLAGVPGVAGRLFSALAAKGISVTMISQGSSEASITLAVPKADAAVAESTLKQEFRADLSRGDVDEVVVQPSIALIAAVGIGMRHTPGIAQRVCSALGRPGINILAVAQGSSELNVTLAVAEAELGEAVRALHAEFGLHEAAAGDEVQAVPVVDLVFLGLGGIGRCLAGMLAARRVELARSRRIDLRIVALADSSGWLHDPSGFDAAALEERISAKVRGEALGDGGDRDPEALLEAVLAGGARRPILVDLTAADGNADLFRRAMRRGFDVVTANKKPLADSAEDYRSLHETAAATGRLLRAEATVGAGLPVLSSLEDLLATGDRVHRIEGCLSGTLGLLTHALEEGRTLSEAVAEAVEMGCTEPDPVVDLSGGDVARKAVILGRLTGLIDDQTQVELEGLVSEELAGRSLEDLLAALRRDYDEALARQVQEAAARQRKLRYVARVEPGRIEVGLRAVPENHPLASLQGSDNRIVVESDRYRERPLAITGPGAGAEVTAMGVFADLLRVAQCRAGEGGAP